MTCGCSVIPQAEIYAILLQLHLPKHRESRVAYFSESVCTSLQALGKDYLSIHPQQ